MNEKPSYMKAVEANCQICKHWQKGDHCNFPGKLKIRNGICMSLEPRQNTVTTNRLTKEGKRWLP